MSKGFVIMAQNTVSTDYIACAKALENSIKCVMPEANVTIVTPDMLPYGDLAPHSDWKLVNDWQVYESSPYDETIKLEADMYIPQDIMYYFDALASFDVCVCSHIRNYKGKLSDVKAYRQFIYDNNLPDVYNAITYFKKSDFASKFYAIVRDVFEHWDEYKGILICNVNEQVTTDWAYSIACHIMGEELTTTRIMKQFSMVHMKQYINDTFTEDWTKELVYEFTNPLKIQSFPQQYPLHYHIKDFGSKLNDHYR